MANHPNRSKAAPIFETATCGRCGGSGNYSRCEMYGTTCFGCGGSGKALTKRGKAARAWLLAQRTVPAKAVKVGDTVAPSGMPRFVVTAVGHLPNSGSYKDKDGAWKPYFTLEGKDVSYGTFEDSPIVVVPTKAVAQEQIAAAIVYQSSLTKSGAPRKGAAAGN
jgi:hypothetical protein